MINNDDFNEILKKSNEERIKYFHDFTMSHPLLIRTIEQAMVKIMGPVNRSIAMVFGPTGVGKSKVRKIIENIIKDDFEKREDENRGVIPIVSIESVASDSGNFNWKDFYKRSLEQLNEPLIDKKVDYDKIKCFNSYNPQFSHNYQGTSPELRKSLENALLYRKPSAFIIDEAQHILKVANGRKLQSQLDTIKSLASLSGVFIILVGTYELLDLIDINGQLNRRIDDIHFPRYQAIGDDLIAFKKIILSFQQHLPLIKEPDLINNWRFIYKRTLGCVGILKDWLEMCLYEALNKNYETINNELLEKHALSEKKVLTMAIEATNGEKKYEEYATQGESLDSILGLDEKYETNEIKVDNKNRKKRNVGQRKPVRDEVGA